MIEKKQSEELIATSSDFNSSNVQVLLCKQDNYLCVLANRKVNYFLRLIMKGKLVDNQVYISIGLYYLFLTCHF